MSDNLFALLAMVRAEMPEVPDEAWEKIKRMLGAEAGGRNVYVPSYRPRSRIQALQTAAEETDAATLAKMLGVTVQHARRMKKRYR